MQAKQVKSGAVIAIDGAPHMVEHVDKHTPSARGAATLYKIRARNLLTQNKTDVTSRGDDNFPEPDFETREVQYLYQSGDEYVFMDLESYDQHSIRAGQLGDQAHYLAEDMEGIFALILEGNIVGIRLPDVVELELVECDPAIKGASATARTKPATTTTGLTVQVPEYMQQGEVIRIDTRTGKFLSRA